jgi:hypothetical protein
MTWMSVKYPWMELVTVSLSGDPSKWVTGIRERLPSCCLVFCAILKLARTQVKFKSIQYI